jgi:DNA gyrase/topoisomerase IV subunit A
MFLLCPPAPFSTAGGVELREEDIIPNSPSVVVYSRKGYIKRMSADTFAVQGVRGTGESWPVACRITSTRFQFNFTRCARAQAKPLPVSRRKIASRT